MCVCFSSDLGSHSNLLELSHQLPCQALLELSCYLTPNQISPMFSQGLCLVRLVLAVAVKSVSTVLDKGGAVGCVSRGACRLSQVRRRARLERNGDKRVREKMGWEERDYDMWALRFVLINDLHVDFICSFYFFLMLKYHMSAMSHEKQVKAPLTTKPSSKSPKNVNWVVSNS